MVAQVFSDEKDIIGSLEKTGQYHKEEHNQIMQRIKEARAWSGLYAPEEARYVLQQDVPDGVKSKLSQPQVKALRALAERLKSQKWDEKGLYNECYTVA